MRLVIHRGTHQIGGSCVELQAEGQRLILDLGLPLVAPGEDQLRLKSQPAVAELVSQGIAPPVGGLYTDGKPDVAAVILSHVHLDHTGLGSYIHPDVPVYATEGTLALLDVASVFLTNPVALSKKRIIPKRTPVQIGPFSVTAIPVDHSAPDAVALLVEAGGKRILYSGDLRAHGRKTYLFRSLLEQPPGKVDALLLEGTTLGRPDGEVISEDTLERQFVEVLRDQRNLALVFCSGQNLDRIVTLFRAAKRLGRTLVIDLYTAYVLDAVRCLSPNLPQHGWDGIRVVPWGYQQRKLRDAGHEGFIQAASPSFVGYREILRRKVEIILLARSNSTLLRLEEKLAGDLEGIRVIWSMWDGYWAEDTHARPFCERNGIQKLDLHTSGHAPWADLQRLVAAIAPRWLVPVHTAWGGRFAAAFTNTVLLEDGQVWGMA